MIYHIQPINTALIIVTFANKEEFEGKLGSDMTMGDTHTFSLKEFIDQGIEGAHIKSQEARNMISYLLKLGWEYFLRNKGLPTYSMSDGGRIFYFTKDLISDDTIYFNGIDGKKTHRNIVGYKTISTDKNGNVKKRIWHFGLTAKPIVYPLKAFIIKSHVIFSDDGYTPWDSKDRMHRARRSQCKNWWNPEWRDRMLATLHWLSDGKDDFEIELGKGITIRIPSLPITFNSPVSFTDPVKEQALDLFDSSEFDEEIDEFGEFEDVRLLEEREEEEDES